MQEESSEQTDNRITLGQVVTLSEAMSMWKLARTTIMIRVWKGEVIARKSGSTWLVTVSGMIAHWGNPIEKVNWDE